MNGSDADEVNAGTPAAGGRVGDPIVEPAVREAAAATETAAHARLKGLDRAERPDRMSSILVAVGAGAHTGATIDVAREIADATGAWLELFHVVPSDDALVDGDATAVDGDADPDEYAAAGDRLLSAARDRLGDFDRVDRWLVEDRTAAGAIVEQSPYYDLVVVGSPTTGTVGRFVFGSTTDTVMDDAEVPVVVVESQGATSLDLG
jgi:nucleotide-binding universal stress UspA family protein